MSVLYFHNIVEENYIVVKWQSFIFCYQTSIMLFCNIYY